MMLNIKEISIIDFISNYAYYSSNRMYNLMLYINLFYIISTLFSLTDTANSK